MDDDLGFISSVCEKCELPINAGEAQVPTATGSIHYRCFYRQNYGKSLIVRYPKPNFIFNYDIELICFCGSR